MTSRPVQVQSGLSVSPTGKNFDNATHQYQVSFYAWSNFNGAPNASGLADNANSEGGTNNVMFAVGTAGNVPLVVGNTGLVTNGAMDGIGFATTGDGGITNDYRIYPASGTIVPTGDSRYAAEWPLLFAFIEASSRLSVPRCSRMRQCQTGVLMPAYGPAVDLFRLCCTP